MSGLEDFLTQLSSEGLLGRYKVSMKSKRSQARCGQFWQQRAWHGIAESVALRSSINQSKVTPTALEKFDSEPLSRNQHWKFQVWPDMAATGPKGEGIF